MSLTSTSTSNIGFHQIERLKACAKQGYTDNDGWLTQLLVMKHGNIGEVNTVH